MVRGFFKSLNERGVSPVIAIVLLLMMTVAAAGAAYFWITSMQSSVQQSAGSQIEAITKQASTRIIAQATLCTSVPPPKGLVGFWPFLEGSGCETEDISENQNNGTLGNSTCGSPDTDEPDWVSGKLGEALDFGGSYVDMGDVLIDGYSEVTVAAWIKPNSITSETPNNAGGNHILSKTGAGSDDNLAFALGNDDELSLYLDRGSTATTLTSTSSPIDTGSWQFVVGVYNGSKVYLYHNGKLITSTSFSGSLTSNIEPLQIGARESVREFFNGRIDEPRIYNRSLSREEVKALYKIGTEGLKESRVRITVYNAGAEEVPEGTWVANLIKNGNTIESDTYNASRLDSEERTMLNFYFSKLHPGGEYKIELEGTETSTTVSC